MGVTNDRQLLNGHKRDELTDETNVSVPVSQCVSTGRYMIKTVD